MMCGPSGQDHFAVEHLKPKTKYPKLVCAYGNLAYACLRCNSIKGEQEPVLDPCRAVYASHFRVQANGTISGLTTTGRKMIRLLRLDRDELTTFRKRYIELAQIAAMNPTNPFSIAWTAATLSFPPDLPDLSKPTPPGGNTRPNGVKTCYFAQRQAGTLPDTY